MRHCWLTLLTFSIAHLFVAVDAFAQPPPPAGQPVPVGPAGPPPLVGQPIPVRPVDARTERAQLLVPHLLPSLAQDKEAAGLAQQSQPELVTWDRIYPLALIRARRATATLEAALDPKMLAEESNRLGVANFARFRQEFLTPHSAAGTGLRDPSAAFLDLLRRVMAIDNARRNVAFHENVEKFVLELIQGESSGLRRRNEARGIPDENGRNRRRRGGPFPRRALWGREWLQTSRSPASRGPAPTGKHTPTSAALAGDFGPSRRLPCPGPATAAGEVPAIAPSLCERRRGAPVLAVPREAAGRRGAPVLAVPPEEAAGQERRPRRRCVRS